MDAIVIFPFILFAKGAVTQKLFIHEMKHWEQVLKYWVIGFYVLYLFYYLRNRLMGMKHYSAYYWIPFEIEARKAEREQEGNLLFAKTLR